MPLGIKLVNEGNVSLYTSYNECDFMPTITVDHMMCHAGRMYQVGNLVEYTNIDDDAVITTCTVTTGANITHMKPRIYVAGVDPTAPYAICCTVWENPTVTLGASTKTPSNRNRNYANSSLNTLYTASSDVSGGTSFGTSLITSTTMTNIGSAFEGDNEFILLPNSSYVWQFTAIGAISVGQLNYRFNWYEVAP